MVRKNRILEVNGVYHVVARRVEGLDLFCREADYHKMLEILSQARLEFDLIYLGYCLMNNHYHLLLSTPQANLSQAMHWINTKYSSYFNTTYDHVGHVFQGRYTAKFIDHDDYLIEVSRYIHLNPVRAGISDRPGEYRYSSYSAYSSGEAGVVVKTDMILEYFGGSISKYLDFVDEGILTGAGLNKRQQDLAKAQDILRELASHYNVEPEELSHLGTLFKHVRNEAVRRIREATDLSMKDIARITGIASANTVQRILNQ